MLHENRREERHRVKLTAEILRKDRRVPGRVIDLSRSGICLTVSPFSEISEGDQVEIYSEELGMLSGKVRWRTTDKIGIALQSSTNTSAKMEAYFKYFSGELV